MNHSELLTWTRIVLGPKIGFVLALKFLGGAGLVDRGAENSELVRVEAREREELDALTFFGPIQ